MDQHSGAVESCYPVATPLLLTGKIVVARDIAHAKIKERLDRGEPLPDYFKNHIIYYAGPAKTPPGYASGSFGPTTAGRMDPYVPIFQAQGGSMIMLAKGEPIAGRSPNPVKSSADSIWVPSAGRQPGLAKNASPALRPLNMKNLAWKPFL